MIIYSRIPSLLIDVSVQVCINVLGLQYIEIYLLGIYLALALYMYTVIRI